MTLVEIDQALAQWENRLSTAAHNLFDLQSDTTYQCLTGSSGAPKIQLTGETAARVNPALDNVGTLFQCFDLLRSTIDQAAQLRRTLPKIFSADQQQEIERLLFTKSIHLPASQVPLDRRSLLSGSGDVDGITPSQLMQSMVSAFDAARDAVAHVDKAWRDLGDAMHDSASAIASLRAEELDVDEARQLDSLEHTLQQIQARTQSDPFGTRVNADAELGSGIRRLQASVEDRLRLRAQVDQALNIAGGKLDVLAQLRTQAAEAHAEAGSKIAGSAGLPAPVADQSQESLREWLDRLLEKRKEGLLRPVWVGIQNWNTAADHCVSQLRKILAANQAPLDSRSELRGRMNALKAKAQAYGVAEAVNLRPLAEEAEALLYARPTPIDKAADAVARYQDAVGKQVTQSKGTTRE